MLSLTVADAECSCQMSVAARLRCNQDIALLFIWLYLSLVRDRH